MEKHLSTIIDDLHVFLKQEKLTKDERGKINNALDLLEEIEANRYERKLVILDLNGVLIARDYIDPKTRDLSSMFRTVSLNEPSPEKIGNFLVWYRPGLTEFLDELFEKFDVAVWSSVTQRNIEQLAKQVFQKHYKNLVFVWSQDQCEILSPTDRSTTVTKPIYLKNLSKVFEKYDYDRVLLVDDDPAKCIKNAPEDVYNPPTWRPTSHSPCQDLMNGIEDKIFTLSDRKISFPLGQNDT